MTFTRISAGYRVTIPADVRAALGAEVGDVLVWRIGHRLAEVGNLRAHESPYAASISSTMSEWDDSADDIAWRGF